MVSDVSQTCFCCCKSDLSLSLCDWSTVNVCCGVRKADWDQIVVGVTTSRINSTSVVVVVVDREAQRDGEESTEEESPFPWPASRSAAETPTQEVQQQKAGFCSISKTTGGDSFVLSAGDTDCFSLSGPWSITRATRLWVSMLRKVWLLWTRTGKEHHHRQKKSKANSLTHNMIIWGYLCIDVFLFVCIFQW